MAYIDFQEIKRTVSIEQAAQKLNLELKPSANQLRGACPACGTGGDRALALTPGRNLFYCFALKKGGDVIELVSHITGLDAKEAAAYLSANAEEPHSTPAPKKENKKEIVFDPAAFAAKLTYPDDLGISEEEATRLGVGEHRGKLYVALRDETGFTAGFVAVEQPKFPKTLLQNNVVKLKRA